ncbi:hypothetical protein [Streptomyces sp. MP131-18]|uniref:hypothetical protein n=1 Tax=Streptomyces sp. MP131-18 TaxID=1857892 RepID=UPI00097BABEE|nr:hypothetical protein [Streptomyces sp. MP131-18]ONK09477.1 hypothetical protein STBA_01770 [Streptomyces sp. MP131-18]
MPQMLKLSGESKDMTLDEIEQFVKLARAADAPGDRPVYAELSTNGKVKQLEISLGEDAERY